VSWATVCDGESSGARESPLVMIQQTEKTQCEYVVYRNEQCMK
jgi:hypothetical protein